MIIAFDPSPGRAGGERIDAVADETHRRKHYAKEGDLERHGAARGIDELRQESDKEQRGLRIQQIHACRTGSLSRGI